MSNIVDLSSRFVPKQEIVFSCLECGGQAFWIDEGGTVTCRTCKMKQKVDFQWCMDAIKIHQEDGHEVIIDWGEGEDDE